MFAKAGDSEAAAVVTDLDQLDDKNYVLITPKYTVTWQNEDGTVLGTTRVREGEIPTTYDRPDKPSDEQGNYGFTGWTPAVVAATADATYTATYKLLDKLTISQGQYIRLGYYNGNTNHHMEARREHRD